MTGKLADVIDAYYAEWMFNQEQFAVDKIGFYNIGYWKGVADSLELAQLNLMETLLSFFANTDGNVVDVACGKGATTRFLTKYFDAKSVTGINISERQLQVARAIAPDCNFRLMDATQLNFGDASFDNVLCVEAAFHFLTRHQFLQEAYRVLKPGGRLAMTDFLMDYDAIARFVDTDVVPPSMKKTSLAAFPRENYLPNLEAYREDMLKIGFKHVRLEDMTALSWDAFFNSYLVKKAEAEREFEKKRDYRRLMTYPRTCIASCLVYAIK